MMNPYCISRPKFPSEALFYSIASVSFLLLLVSCAAQAPPPGGPVDTVKPRIDSVWPHQRELNVSRNPEIYLQFSQDIDEQSFNQAFSVSPYLNGTPKFHWSGFNRVRVEFPDTLRDSTTYTVELTRDLKTHPAAGGSPRGGQIPSPFFLTFSTGPKIDTGELSGFLLVPLHAPPMKPSSLYVFGYDITVQNPDTLNFSTTPPDLLTQPNDQGLWQFLAMKAGHRYRVFALEDVYKNKLYDAGVDAFGVPSSDAFLDSATKTGMYIRMAPPTDTIKPEMTDVEAVDSFHIRAHFSEAIDSESVRAAYFTLSSSSPEAGKVVSAFRNDKKPGQITLLLSQPLKVKQEYTLEAIRDSVRDLTKNSLSDSAYKVTFTSPDELRHVDTVAFVTMNLRDSTRDMSQLPEFPMIFSDAVNRDSVERAVKLIDSSHHAVPIRFRWHDDAKVWFQPADSLLSNVFYTIEFYTSGVQ
ncbi:MAG TPA: Ig-like domain-containing protein, partial [Candidatus Kapabacteria bacterium]